jgi:hypothetical protein
MDVRTAMELINSGNIRLMPYWDIEATDHTNRFEGAVCVKVTYPSYETSREMARSGYPEQNRPYASFPIVVRDLDDIGLYRALVKIITEIQEHETREFLRIGPTYWAPFHPHQIDGMRRWDEGSAEVNDSFQLRGDLRFGLS